MSGRRREQAWQAGHNARLKCKPRTSCDRRLGTIFYDDWQDGYNDADNQLWHINVAEPKS